DGAYLANTAGDEVGDRFKGLDAVVLIVILLFPEKLPVLDGTQHVVQLFDNCLPCPELDFGSKLMARSVVIVPGNAANSCRGGLGAAGRKQLRVFEQGV